MASDSRKKNYKHTGLDSEELRKRREDLNITLRKQKREEQVCKSIDECRKFHHDVRISSISNDEISRLLRNKKHQHHSVSPDRVRSQ